MIRPYAYRLEWTSDAINSRSRHAASRFGFQFEGILRQYEIAKSKNRDEAWFSIIDREWPPLRRAYSAWLSAENFSAEGAQLRRLQDFMHQHTIGDINAE